MFLVSVYTQVTSRSWFLLWSWRATRPCGSQQSASTKCASPSARIQSWRCAPRAWGHRQKHCGSVCLFSCSISFHKIWVFFNCSFSLRCHCHRKVIIESGYSGYWNTSVLCVCVLISLQHLRLGSHTNHVCGLTSRISNKKVWKCNHWIPLTWSCVFCVLSQNLRFLIQHFYLPPPAAKCEPVLRANMHGGRRGEAPHSTHSVLLKDLQGLGAFTSSRQHYLRLQGECGDLFAGKQLAKDETKQGMRRDGEVWILLSSIFKARGWIWIYATIQILEKHILCCWPPISW